MGMDKTPSPWGRGAEHEAEVGPEETKAIRERVHGENEIRQRARADAARSFFSDEEENEHDRELELGEFLKFSDSLDRAGGTYEHSYAVDSDGHIQDDGGSTDVPDLLACAQAEVRGLSSGNFDIIFKPASLIEAALRIHEKFPDIAFTFPTKRPKDSFTYRATRLKNSD